MSAAGSKLNVVVTSVERAPAELVDAFAQFGTTTTHEAARRSPGLMKPYMRPVWRGACISGTAITALAQPGDNWMLHVAIEQCRPGDILVVGVTSENTDGMFGDLLATSLMARGVRGIVIDAGARDVSALESMQFPTWSRAISSRGTVKATLGSVNVPVVCAGVLVNPGDIVVADDDGVVIVPRREAPAVLAAARKRHAEEEIKRARLAAGVLGLDLYDMRPVLERNGMRWISRLEDETEQF